MRLLDRRPKLSLNNKIQIYKTLRYWTVCESIQHFKNPILTIPNPSHHCLSTVFTQISIFPLSSEWPQTTLTNVTTAQSSTRNHLSNPYLLPNFLTTQTVHWEGSGLESLILWRMSVMLHFDTLPLLNYIFIVPCVVYSFILFTY